MWPDVRLATIAESDSTGELAGLYHEIRDHFGLGFVPDVFQLLSTRPVFLRTMWEIYLSLFDDGVLPRGTKELIATFVARDAGCQYCVAAHSLLAEVVGAGPDIVAAAQADSPAEMDVDEKLRGLMQLVAQIDSAAHRIVDDDIVNLRALGWRDAELLEAIWTACVFNAIVRLVDAFGLTHLGQLATPSTPAPASHHPPR